jgi:hypothetical protein
MNGLKTAMNFNSGDKIKGQITIQFYLFIFLHMGAAWGMLGAFLSLYIYIYIYIKK